MNEINKYNLKLYILCTIKNCFVLGCFTILAIIFNHWWIVFFSILFMGWPEKGDD